MVGRASACQSERSSDSFFSPLRLCASALNGPSRRRNDFDHPWALLALLLPLGWAAWEWRGSARRLALGLKAAAFVCIVLALSGPRLMVYQTKVAVAVLADTSASLSPEDLAHESAIASEVQRGHGRHWTRVMPFARGTRMLALEENTKNGWQLRHTAGAAGHGTRSGSRHPRRRGGAARGHGAAPGAGLRRQREPGQRGARHLAGAAARHPHRYRGAGRPSQARTAARIASPFPGRCSAASASRSKSPLESPRAAHATRGDDGRRQDHRRQQRGTGRRRESSAPAGQRQLGGRDRAGRQDLGRRPGRGALRRCRHAAPVRACCWCRTIRPASEEHLHPHAAGQSVRSGAARPAAIPDEARRFPARRDQQLGHGIHSGCRARRRWRHS